MGQEKERVPHEYLEEKDYYETQTVSRGRQEYMCDHCFKSIPKGSPSDVHKFYPEFYGERTHPECSKAFKESLLTKEEVKQKYQE